MDTNTKKISSITVGFFFFAILFGAGNLLFPPLLGYQSGPYWWLAIFAFIITDAVLAFLLLYLFSRTGSLEILFKPLGNKFLLIYGLLINIIIFSLFLIPRTASMTYELSIQPFVPENFSSWYFYLLYFGISILFAINKSSILETLGKYLAPILALAILCVIIFGIINIPTQYAEVTNVAYVFKQGFIGGYQTGDMLGILFEAALVISLLNSKGITAPKERQPILIKGGIIFIALFSILYFGLGFIGAKLGGVLPENTGTIEILRYIAYNSLGTVGSNILAFTVFITCITTTIGVLSFVSHYLSSNLTKVKLSYKTWVCILSIIGIIMAHQGVDFIVKVAVPILFLFYPISIMLVILQLFYVKSQKVIAITCYTAFAFSFIETFASLKFNFAQTLLKIIPLGEIGFVWAIPSLLVFIISYFIFNKNSRTIIK